MTSAHISASTERYDPNNSEYYWLNKYHNKIITLIPTVANKKVLDAGSGYGLTEPVLLSMGAEKVDAFDIENESIEYSRIKYPSDKLNFEVKDFNEMGFKLDYYDVALSVDVLEHLKNYEFYLSNIAKSLKIGGKLFLVTPNKKMSLGLNEFHLKEFTSTEMEQLFEKYSLKILDFKGITPSREITKIGSVTPKIVLVLIRKFKFLHKFLIDRLENFHQEDPEQSNSLVYLCEKI